MASWTLAIDFGTTYTVGVVARGSDLQLIDAEADGSSRMPSAVFLDHDDLVVGRAAVHQAAFAPDRFEPTPKRWVGKPEMPLGGRYVPIVELVGAVLRRVGDEARKVAGGTPATRVVLTHPAEWAEGRCTVLLEAAGLAGLDHVELVPEPVSAAAHIAGIRIRTGEHVAVYDFGGGTFDAAVLLRTPEGFELAGPTGGCDPLGGEDIDRRIIEYLGTGPIGQSDEWAALRNPADERWRLASVQFRDEVRQAKEQLSFKETWQLWVPGLERKVMLARSELNELIERDVERTLDILEATIDAAGITARDLAGIFLVGGSSRIPLVADRVWSRFERQPGVQGDPKTVVALGAATWRPRQDSGARVFRSRLAMVRTTAFLRTGAAAYAYVTVLEGDARASASDEPTDARSLDEAVAGRGGELKGRAGYVESSFSPAEVLGAAGLERTFSIEGDNGRTAFVERYALIDGRLITLTARDSSSHLLDTIGYRRPELPTDRFTEMCFTVEQGDAVSVQERMVLVSGGTGHRIIAEGFDLPPGTTPDLWAQQRSASYVDNGWEKGAERSGRILGRPQVAASGGMGDVARLLDGVPAAVRTFRQVGSTGALVTRVWTAVVDDRGYSVVVTLPEGAGGFKPLAGHALLTAPATSAGQLARELTDRFKRGWLQSSPLPGRPGS